MHGEIINSFRILVRNPQRNEFLRKPMHKRKDTIKIDLKESGCEDVECIQYVQSRVQY